MSCSSLIYEKLPDSIAKGFEIEHWYNQFLVLDDTRKYAELMVKYQRLKHDMGAIHKVDMKHYSGKVLPSLRGNVYISELE